MENEPLNNQEQMPVNQEQNQAPKKNPLKIVLWVVMILIIGTATYFGLKEEGTPALFKAALTEPGTPGNQVGNWFYISDAYEALASDSVLLEIRAGDDIADNIEAIRAFFSYDSTKINFNSSCLVLTGTPFVSPSNPACDDSVTNIIEVQVFGGGGFNVNPGDVVIKLQGTLTSSVSPGDTVAIDNTFLEIVDGDFNLIDPPTSVDFGDGEIRIDKTACSTAEPPNNPDWNCTDYNTTVNGCDSPPFETRICTQINTQCEPGNDLGNGEYVNQPPLQQICTCHIKNNIEPWTCGGFSNCEGGTRTRTCTYKIDASFDVDQCKPREIGTITPDDAPYELQICGQLTGDIDGLILTLDEATVNTLTPAQRSEAFAAAVVMINSSAADGITLDIEGEAITLDFDDDINDIESEKLENIAQNLADAINDTSTYNLGLTATPNTRMPSGTVDLPGLVLINTTTANNDNDVDIDQTFQAGNVSIFPFPVNGLTLLQTDNFSMQVMAIFADNTTRLVTAQEVVWVNDTFNRLSDIDLDAGRLKAGVNSGFSTVYATVTTEDTTAQPPIQRTFFSNTLTVNVPSGPVIEEAVRIGVSPITSAGGRVNLRVTVSDFDTIQDIAQIFVDLVDANDPGRIFDSTAVVNEVSFFAGEGVEVDAQGNVEKFRTYNIPIDIIQNSLMFDGPYNLKIRIKDAAGFEAEAVVPITIGAIVATGNVHDQDNVLNQLDVIDLYNFYTKKITLTPDQIAAGNMDGVGGITLVDVILLYNLVNQ